MAELERVRVWANALIRMHLNTAQWSFGFDNAKRRAGQCDYTRRRISVSRYLAAKYDEEEIHQILLHEVAHALAGSRAGHGAQWTAVARQIGYVGGRLHNGEAANELAPWVGTCPAGHRHFRHRSPATAMSCGLCGPGFNRTRLIEWRRREISAATRRTAGSNDGSAARGNRS